MEIRSKRFKGGGRRRREILHDPGALFHRVSYSTVRARTYPANTGKDNNDLEGLTAVEAASLTRELYESL